MELLQEILVFLTFLIASGYLFTKFVWKPSFTGGKSKKQDKACGVTDCGCS